MQQTISNRYSQVRVGVSVLVTWNRHLLLAKRKGSHGAGTWDSPGGHLEPGERAFECAMRETLEETGIVLNVENMQELGYTEDFFDVERKHYISCVISCEIDGNNCKPVVLEPHKFATEWQWFKLDELPSPLFIPLKNALEKFM